MSDLKRQKKVHYFPPGQSRFQRYVCGRDIRRCFGGATSIPSEVTCRNCLDMMITEIKRRHGLLPKV